MRKQSAQWLLVRWTGFFTLTLFYNRVFQRQGQSARQRNAVANDRRARPRLRGWVVQRLYPNEHLP